jgi:ubiquinone/menaquinone biosynthesis C-methylase UbiE
MSEARSRSFVASSVPEAYERYTVPQLFEPWAGELLRVADPATGASVLDIASGPGTVARLAAARVGENGRVLASDISASMLQIAAARKPEPGSAPLSILACSALDLDVADESFQFVLCQQGLQFFPDRPSALREMHRALEPDGVVALATWASERPLGLFGPMTEAMRESGLAEPFPRAFDPTSYTLPASEMQALVETSGFRDVRVETVELDCIWKTGTEALASVSGTVFGPALALLSSDEQDTAMAIFLERLAANRDDELTIRTASNIVRGVK